MTSILLKYWENLVKFSIHSCKYLHGRLIILMHIEANAQVLIQMVLVLENLLFEERNNYFPINFLYF
jgi:hypothetical protein